ncbi:MAG: hypothetical protein MUW51_06250 [Lactococcus lactis]|nr:hypothetical protein [Lactococcus lactis]
MAIQKTSAFFLRAEEEARKFWLKSANAKTGLTPEYADYEENLMILMAIGPSLVMLIGRLQTLA